MAESRVQKSLLNAKVNLLFYVLTLVLAFFSRKIFLDCLGADFVGLSGTLQNLLAFLNLAELGVGAAIGYVLYKPLFDRDEHRICEIISVFGFLYRRIGLIILALGLLLACFLPLIFPKTGFETGVVYAVYSAFLASSLIGYFCNYKQTLLGADQRNYVVTAYFQSAAIVKTLIQMACALHTGSYYLWAAIELAFGIIYSFILNWKVNQTYPWLKSDVRQGRSLLRQYPIVVRKAKQLFVHQVAGMARYQILPVLAYAYTSLQVVAFYGNYTLIIDKVSIFISNLLGSTGAGVGNLIAEGDTKRILSVYWELLTLRYFIAGTVVYLLHALIDPFISIWLGSQYLLDNAILMVILFSTFVGMTRGVTEQFNYGYGLFHDTWAPLVTMIITLSVAVCCGARYGLLGVLFGDIASSATIICVWKPCLLFREGIRKSVFIYWRYIARLLAAMGIAWGCSAAAMTCLRLSFSPTTYLEWLWLAVSHGSVFIILFALVLAGFCPTASIHLIKRLTGKHV